MNVLAHILAQMLVFGGALSSGFVHLAMPLAFGVGLATSLVGAWMMQIWPAPKPMFLPVTIRPKPQTLRSQRWIAGIVGVVIILAGIMCVLLLPKTLPLVSFTQLFRSTGSNVVGQGVGYLIFGWITAPKEVAAHNAWSAKMGGNVLR